MGDFGQFPDAPGAGHILGQIKVVHPGRNSRLRNRSGEVKWCSAEHRELPFKCRTQGVRVSDIECLRLDPRTGLDAPQRGLRRIGHRNHVILAGIQQGSNGRADFSGAYKQNFIHEGSMVCATKILASDLIVERENVG